MHHWIDQLVPQPFQNLILQLHFLSYLRSGTPCLSVLLNASLNYQLVPQPFQNLILQLHFLSFLRSGTPCLSFFFDYLCICRSLWDLSLQHLSSYSHTNHAAFKCSPKLTITPAGTWRLYNVGSTSMQSHDVASTLRRRCINVMYLLAPVFLAF